MTSEIFPRRLSELDAFRGEQIAEGHFLHVSQERRQALLANPYLDEEDAICEWVGYADGKPAGFNYSFPIHVWADGKTYRSTTGSCLNVEEWARKTDLGMILPAKGVEITSKDGIAIAAACSQMAVPLHQINGYKYFFFPRYIALWRCRSVVERFLPRWLVKPISVMGDIALWMYAWALKGLVKCALRGYRVVAVAADDESGQQRMADVVAADVHRFREDHDSAWFKWHMTCSFSVHGPCRGFLLHSKKDGNDLAFCLAKQRFHKQASSRGFKNVWLGSIVEWGASAGYERKLGWFILAVVLMYARNCDAVEFATDDTILGRFVRRLGWRKVGDANVGIKVMKKFPLYGDSAIKEQSNWRIRPGMGDNALS